MICHELKLIFIHPPKTAGHSIESFFLDYLEVPWGSLRAMAMGHNFVPEDGPQVLDHMTSRQYVEFGYVTKRIWNSYHKVVTIRNPWARLLSEWRFSKYGVTFRDFVLQFFPRISWDDRYVHVIPQTDFVALDESSGMDECPNFIRFESLEEDFRALCRHLGILGEVKLPHKRESKKTGPLVYVDWYDDEMLERFSQIYSDDIRNLGYSFGDRE